MDVHRNKRSISCRTCLCERKTRIDGGSEYRKFVVVIFNEWGILRLLWPGRRNYAQPNYSDLRVDFLRKMSVHDAGFRYDEGVTAVVKTPG